MVHSAVGVNHGVLHEAAVLVDLLLGHLRFRGWVSRVAILAARRRRRAVLASRRQRRTASSCSGVAVAAWRVVLKYPGRFRLGANASSTLVHATWGSYTGCGAALSMRCWRATLRKAGRARLSSIVQGSLICCRAWRATKALLCKENCTEAVRRRSTRP
jgi:hypothetical protein